MIDIYCLNAKYLMPCKVKWLHVFQYPDIKKVFAFRLQPEYLSSKIVF